MYHIPARIVEEWTWKNRKEMISCPYPPGRLKISKRAGKKRYEAGRRAKESGGDFLHYTYRQRIQVCKKCPIGGQLPASYT